jgi:hypothetical protein
MITNLGGQLGAPSAGVITYWRRHRSSNVAGPHGPGTWSTLIPVSGRRAAGPPSSSRVLAFQSGYGHPILA